MSHHFPYQGRTAIIGTSCHVRIVPVNGWQGRLPADLSELVPDHLPEVPYDPCAPTEALHYVPRETGYLLYSVGLDGVDDGGLPDRDRLFRICLLLPEPAARDPLEE